MCEICGGSLPPRGRRGPAPRYCSARCRHARYEARLKASRLAANVAKALPCRGCGGAIPPARCRYGRAQFCSPECRERHIREREIAQRPVRTVSCAWCGTPFEARRVTARFCQKRCWRRFYSDLRNELIRAHKPLRKRLTWREIGERDGWICHICDEHVIGEEASVDHLVPLVHGGADTPENVALAHKSCNSRRGARPLSDLARAG